MMREANRAVFEYMSDGRPVEEVVLHCGTLSCTIITYGGAVRTLTVADESGKPTDVVLGFDTLKDYRKHDKYLGALVGRYANRIGRASFTLNGVEYSLTTSTADIRVLTKALDRGRFEAGFRYPVPVQP